MDLWWEAQKQTAAWVPWRFCMKGRRNVSSVFMVRSMRMNSTDMKVSCRRQHLAESSINVELHL